MNISQRTLCSGVAAGNKIFGAAILRKTDLSLLGADTNKEIENPLYHGEISTLNAFFEISNSDRPQAEDCIFVSTHEPCSLCLSAITWSKFDKFYYFFGYQDTRDNFNIPHDLNILKEVFKIDNGQYAKKNKYWESKDIISIVKEISNNDDLILQVERIRKHYTELSAIYQETKDESDIPLH